MSEYNVILLYPAVRLEWEALNAKGDLDATTGRRKKAKQSQGIRQATILPSEQKHRATEYGKQGISIAIPDAQYAMF
ncbi:hypothetical protein V2S85_17480 [Novosphingobium resinovorum]|nr:hypothetical protein [Novosphingobium resinovorum]